MAGRMKMADSETVAMTRRAKRSGSFWSRASSESDTGWRARVMTSATMLMMR